MDSQFRLMLGGRKRHQSHLLARPGYRSSVSTACIAILSTTVLFATLTNPATATETDSAGADNVLDSRQSTIDIDRVRVSEDTGTVTVLISRKGATDESCTFTVFSRADSAMQGEDYYGAAARVEIAAGDSLSEVSFIILDDTLPESTEKFFIEQGNHSEFCRAGSNGEVTIDDNDGDTEEPVVNISSATVSEGDGTATLDVTLAEASSETCTLLIWSRNDSAIPGQDFYGATSEVSFDPGEVNQTIEFTILDDTMMEDDEQFLVLQGKHENCQAGSSASVIIEDNDDDGNELPVASIGSTTVTEGEDSEAEVEVTLSTASTEIVSVIVASRETGSAISGPDYAGRPYEVVFAAGETSKTVSWSIIDDEDEEETESFRTAVEAADNAEPGSGGTVTILDDDSGDDNLVLVRPIAVKPEGFTPATVVFYFETTLPEDCSFTVTTVDGTATAGEDYESSSQMITILAGTAVAKADFMLLGDSINEPDELVELQITDMTGPCESRENGLISILDDDEEPDQIARIQSAVIPESEGNTTFPVIIDRAVDADCTVRVEAVDGTAIEGTDYTSNSPYEVTIPAGQNLGFGQFTTINNDATEDDKTFQLNIIETLGPCVEGSPATITIADDDNEVPRLPLIRFVLAEESVYESGNWLGYSLRAEAMTEECEIQISTVAGTATEGEDFINDSTTFVFPVGPSRSLFGLRFGLLLDDVVDEDPETLTLKLELLSGACRIGGDSQITIIDRD